MNTTTQEQAAAGVGQLGNFRARMLRSFRAAVDDWDEVCSALGAWEAQHLAKSDSDSAMKQHREWVTELLSWGQLVQRATEHPQFPDKALTERVNSRVRHLQDKLDMWQSEMTPAEEEHILSVAFE